jgi:opacity protein-like surface antigen
MRRALLTLIFLTILLNANAQSASSSNRDSIPKVYLGVGVGLNNYTGLIGLSVNVRVYHKFFLQGGIGIGSWGSKMSIGARYDLSYKKGWSFGAGLSSASGLKDFKTNLEVKSGNKQDVQMDLLRANTLNIKATYFFRIGKRHNFYLESGYAVPLQSSPYTIKDGSVLSSTSKAAMDLAAPGGLIFGLGFTFGL